MTKDFLDVMYLFSCSAHGIEPEPREVNIDKIFQLSVSQGIWFMVYDSLRKINNSEKLKKLGESVVFACAKNAVGRSTIHGILKQLDDAAIPYCMLKGETLAQLYHCRDLRISSDTDIFVGYKYEKKTTKIFEKNGFEAKYTAKTSHHTHCTHELCGLVEIHRSLHDELFEDIWFDNCLNITEDYARLKSDDGYEIQTLGITDGAVFVCMHMIKHFLSKGIGIRQIMDTLLYFKHYRTEIDWDRFNALLQHLKYDKFMEYIKGIGVTYLGFNENDFLSYDCDESVFDEILNDCEHGGVFGHNDQMRQDFYQFYTSKRYSRFYDIKSYYKNMAKMKSKNIGSLIFGTKSELKRKYAYCNKHVFLLPIACVNRWIDTVIKAVSQNYSIKQNFEYTENFSKTDDVEKRMELIEKLDMI